MVLADGRLPLYVPLLFIAVPVGLVIIAVTLLVKARRQSTRIRTVPDGWVRAPGLVVDERTWRESRGNSNNSTSVFIRQPIVTYRTPSGHDVTFTSAITGTFMPEPGTSIAVCHDPADPTQARIAPESIPKSRAFSAVATVLVVVLGVPLVTTLALVGVFLLRIR